MGGASPRDRAADVCGAAVLSRLGHELRSPLAGIIGLARVLLAGLEAGTAGAATQARQIQLIQASAARSLATTEQVVYLANIAAARVRPQPQSVDCRDIVAHAAAVLRPAAAKRGVRLRADVPGRPVTATTDPQILGLMLRELAGNGLRFTTGDEVRIRLHAGREPVVMDVSDDGPGIPVHEQARIFEPFERGELAAARDDDAPGLGLYLACQQATLLGARLSLRSGERAGSTFTVTLARLPGPAGAGAGPDPGS